MKRAIALLDNFYSFRYFKTTVMAIRKKTQIFIFLFAAAITISSAQRKSDLDQNQSASPSFLAPSTGGLMFGWFDPNRLLMNQSISFSYATNGARGYSLAAYTNSLLYKSAIHYHFDAISVFLVRRSILWEMLSRRTFPVFI